MAYFAHPLGHESRSMAVSHSETLSPSQQGWLPINKVINHTAWLLAKTPTILNTTVLCYPRRRPPHACVKKHSLPPVFDRRFRISYCGTLAFVCCLSLTRHVMHSR